MDGMCVIDIVSFYLREGGADGLWNYGDGKPCGCGMDDRIGLAPCGSMKVDCKPAKLHVGSPDDEYCKVCSNLQKKGSQCSCYLPFGDDL